MSSAIIAVHCGAGRHSSKFHKEYNKLCRKACQRGMEVLENGGSSLEAVKIAVIVLENDPLTNAGYGSNLTVQGLVEGDASVMDGKTLTFGGCGAVKKVKNPISLAYDLCIKQLEPLPLGLIPPSLLVGAGGLCHAKNVGIEVVSNKRLISEKAVRQFNKYKQMLDLYEEEDALLDTVGAVCIDDTGHVASACSSGGLLLKRPGRVGQAALYGSGVWADSLEKTAEPSVAVCTTGCGEHLVQTQLAKVIAEDLKLSSSPTIDLHKSMTEKFLKSRHLRNIKQKLGGVLVLHVNNTDSGEVSLLWGHSTESMGVGYMRKGDPKPKSMISLLPKDVEVGLSVNVGGTCFYIEKKVS